MSGGLVAMDANVADAVGTEGNALNPTCRLPPGVLANIFQFCADMLPPQMDWEFPGWLLVTHVCRYWRSVALGHPRLWTNIEDGLTEPWLKIMLARAKSAPLSAKLSGTAVATYNGELSKHVSCIRTLAFLACNHDDLISTTPSMLTSPANNLQYFKLHSTGLSDTWLPEHIFQDHTPQLRSFILLDVRIPWSAPILSNLTHLVISTLSSSGTYRSVVLPDDGFSVTSFDEFLSALRRMPALKKLDLARSIPPTSRPLTTGDIVELPYLTGLKLAARTIQCADVLKCIQMPPTCSLTLTCLGDSEIEATTAGGEAGPIADVVSLFHAHVNREHTPMLSLDLPVYVPHLIFDISMSGNDAIELAHTLKLPHLQDPGGPLPEFYSSKPSGIIFTVCHGLPLETLRTITLGPIAQKCLAWTPQAWIDVFGCCSAAEDVRIIGEHGLTQTFCAALTMRVPEGPAFLGNMRRLALENMNAPYAFRRNKEQGDAFYDAILKHLDARQRMQAIQSVRMNWQGMKEQFIAGLENIVPEVEWVE